MVLARLVAAVKAALALFAARIAVAKSPSPAEAAFCAAVSAAAVPSAIDDKPLKVVNAAASASTAAWYSFCSVTKLACADVLAETALL